MVGQRPDKKPRFFRDAKFIQSMFARLATIIDDCDTDSDIPTATPTAAPVADAILVDHAAGKLASDTTPAQASPTYPRPNLPRLYFSGKFYTDPSTTNNYVNYYDVDKFRPTYQLLVDELNLNGSWSPGGTATFALVDCTVTSTYSPTDGEITQALREPLIGQSIVYNRRSVYGKISDLDPQMQTVSTLYGVRVNIGDDDVNTSDAFSSTLQPTSFRDLWGGTYNPNAADTKGAYMQGYGAVYQGLLSLDSFKHADSKFLEECQQYVDAAAAYTDENGNHPYPNGALSIRFRTDWYSNDPTSPDFRYGNCTGYITPWIPGYPTNYDANRQLYTTSQSNGTSDEDGNPVALTNLAYATVEQKPDGSYSLFVDLVNSLYRLQTTGSLEDVPGTGSTKTWKSPYQDQGTLDVGYFDSPYLPSSPSAPGITAGAGDDVPNFVKIANVPYNTQDFDDSSSVLDLPLSEAYYTALQSKQLVLRATKNGVVTYPLAEPSGGFFSRADTFVFHLQGSSTPSSADAQIARIYCSKWGVLQSAQSIVVGFDSSGMQSDGQNSVPSGPRVGEPVAALTVNSVTPADPDPLKFRTTIVTGAGGYAELSLLGGDCENPRRYIDGQVYALRYAAGTKLPRVDPGAPNNEKINLLLFDVFTGAKHPGSPSWLVDILPIFKLYANLYPAMGRIVQLDDYGSVVERSRALKRVFTAKSTDPAYMPTTRDLSDAKRTMIVDWLSDPTLPFMNQTKDDVYEALQTIIELEHATMPPYLTALYSLKKGYNQYIADTLRDVAMQEMLHFCIACNILTAIGGEPNISKIGFVPKFPGTLPGGLRSGLIVRLRKCCKEQLKAFMAIEAPEEQYLLEDGESNPNNPLQKNEYTIGWVYDAVSDALAELTPTVIQFPDDIPDIQSDDPRIALQVTTPFGNKLFPIMNLQDAQQAIKIIKEEGEGSPASNDPTEGDTDPDTQLPMLSHYFRFAEIVRGRRLIVDDTVVPKTYNYNGPRIDLDMDGVYNMQDDPKIEDQPLGSQQRERMESFSLKYQGLLNGLQIAFSKDPGHIDQCLGLMFQLTIAAQPLMEMPALNEDGSVKSDGTTCGISFQVPMTETGL